MPSVIFCAEEPAQTESPIKAEFETFMKEEGTAFFDSTRIYFTPERISQAESIINQKIDSIEDLRLKEFLRDPKQRPTVMDWILAKLKGSVSEKSQAVTENKREKDIHVIEAFVRTYTFQNVSDRTKTLAILSDMKRLLLKIVIEEKLPGYIPLNKKYKKIYSFVEEICKANNLATPKIYIGRERSDSDAFFSKIDGQPIIALRSSFFRCHNENAIKAVIAHELGHYYYGDTSRKANFFIEYRADLFSANYGFGPSGASAVLGKSHELDSNQILNLKNSNPEPLCQYYDCHPSPVYRAKYLAGLPTEQLLQTVGNQTYRVTHEPYYLKEVDNILGLKLEPKLTRVTNPILPGKIVNTTAQP
jgi:predicted SprT family Zn-dependent metalloprotease